MRPLQPSFGAKDRQDVVIIQAHGRKRWQVFYPPDVGEVDPLRRGKDGDVAGAKSCTLWAR